MFRARPCPTGLLPPWIRGCLWSAILIGLTPLPQAVAQTSQTPSAASESSAKALFLEGLEHSRADRAAEAVLAFERSRALLERPSVLQNLAFALERVGRYADALDVIDRFFTLTNSDARASGRSELTALRDKLKQRVLVLRLTLEPSDAALQVDGVPRDQKPGSMDTYLLVLDPGRHVLRATRHGYADHDWQLVAAPGASLTDKVVLARVEPAPAQTLTLPPAVDLHAPPRAETPSRSAAWAWTLSGTSLALGAVGLVLYARAGQRIEDCPAAGCSRSEGKIIRRLDYTARGLFIAAGVAAVGAGVSWYRMHRNQRQRRSLTVHPSGHVLLRMGF